MTAVFGNFELSRTCTAKGCEDKAIRILVFHEYDSDQMTVCCFCIAHALHHESQFKERGEVS